MATQFFRWFESICKKCKTLIIIKTHPLDNLRILKKYSNITHLKNNDLTKLNLDLQDLISVSDGLITDISSVIIDYILTKKHLGITINSIKSFKRGLISELKLFNNLKFHSIKNINDFKIFFKKINTNQKVNIDPKNIFYSKKAINSSKQIMKFFNIWNNLNINILFKISYQMEEKFCLLFLNFYSSHCALHMN